jgi:hypothetical protein
VGRHTAQQYWLAGSTTRGGGGGEGGYLDHGRASSGNEGGESQTQQHLHPAAGMRHGRAVSSHVGALTPKHSLLPFWEAAAAAAVQLGQQCWKGGGGAHLSCVLQQQRGGEVVDAWREDDVHARCQLCVDAVRPVTGDSDVHMLEAHLTTTEQQQQTTAVVAAAAADNSSNSSNNSSSSSSSRQRQ